MNLKFDGWPWKTIGHLFYTTPSIVHHFKSIYAVKLEFQSGNAQFGSKLGIFCPASPWNLMDDLKNNRTPLLYYIKLCASFQSHRWILTGVTVRKRSIRVKTGNFLSCVNLTDDIEKQYGTSPILLQALCIISWPLVTSNWSYSPEMPNLGQNQQFFSRVTLKFDGWPWKTIGHLS